MHRNTKLCVVLLRAKINNIKFLKLVISFQHNQFFLTVIFMRLKACRNPDFLRTGHQNLDTGNGMKIRNFLISRLLQQHIIYFWLLLTNGSLAFDIFLVFHLNPRQIYVIMNENLILTYDDKNNFCTHLILVSIMA